MLFGLPFPIVKLLNDCTFRHIDIIPVFADWSNDKVQIIFWNRWDNWKMCVSTMILMPTR